MSMRSISWCEMSTENASSIRDPWESSTGTLEFSGTSLTCSNFRFVSVWFLPGTTDEVMALARIWSIAQEIVVVVYVVYVVGVGVLPLLPRVLLLLLRLLRRHKSSNRCGFFVCFLPKESQPFLYYVLVPHKSNYYYIHINVR